MQKKVKAFNFTATNFLLRASRERYIRIFRYPRHDKIVHTMTFRRIILRVFSYVAFGTGAAGEPILPQHKAFCVSLGATKSCRLYIATFSFIGIRSIMVTFGVWFFPGFTLHGSVSIDARFLRLFIRYMASSLRSLNTVMEIGTSQHCH